MMGGRVPNSFYCMKITFYPTTIYCKNNPFPNEWRILLLTLFFFFPNDPCIILYTYSSFPLPSALSHMFPICQTLVMLSSGTSSNAFSLQIFSASAKPGMINFPHWNSVAVYSHPYYSIIVNVFLSALSHL